MKTLAKRCECIIKGYGVDEWGAKDFDGNELMKGLASIRRLPACQGCLKGGGNDLCKIRPCASNKKLSDCMKCDETKSYSNSETLQKVRTGALTVGMLATTRHDQNRRELVEKWAAQIKSKCSHCGI